MSSANTVTVVIPTYNGEHYLGDALRSLEGQGPALLEVLLIDDGSNDKTVELARSFQSVLPLRIVERGRVGSWVANTNWGIKESRGEFVSILHQDDCWLPERLKVFAERSAANPGIDVFLNPSFYIDGKGVKIGRWTAPLAGGEPLSGESVRNKLVVQNFISMPGPIFRRALVPDEKPMDESLWYTADWKLWLSLTERGSWFYHPIPLSCFRVHAHSLTARAVVDDEYRKQFTAVVSRYTSASTRERLLADFSIEVNMFLASLFNGKVRGGRALLCAAWTLGFNGLSEYRYASRIGERVRARIRALLGARFRPPFGLPRSAEGAES